MYYTDTHYNDRSKYFDVQSNLDGSNTLGTDENSLN